jgi:hypothetical protein
MPHVSRAAPPAGGVELGAVARFLRGLADRAEQDPAFGQQIATLLAEAGLLPGSASAPAGKRAARAGSAGRRVGGAAVSAAVDVDPYSLLRTEGDETLRARLSTLTPTELHSVIRTHRLDPARISARWTSPARLIDLIVAQVRARADHGKAFSRV